MATSMEALVFIKAAFQKRLFGSGDASASSHKQFPTREALGLYSDSLQGIIESEVDLGAPT